MNRRGIPYVLKVERMKAHLYPLLFSMRLIEGNEAVQVTDAGYARLVKSGLLQ